MKNILLAFTLLLSLGTFSQNAYWQQEVNYDIRVTLNDKNQSLKGDITIDYINHSPDTLQFIYFHLWPNAYRNKTTAFAKQLSADSESRQKLNNAQRGFIDSIAFRVNDVVSKSIFNF